MDNSVMFLYEIILIDGGNVDEILKFVRDNNYEGRFGMLGLLVPFLADEEQGS